MELHCENACGLKLTMIDNNEYGLVGHKDEGIVPKAQITSIDQVFRVKDTTNLAPTTFVVKSRQRLHVKLSRQRWSTLKLHCKMKYMATFHFAAKLHNAEVFKKQIPQRSHRIQVLHHAAVLQCSML